jgi:very-short-patch-repair endonuclease
MPSPKIINNVLIVLVKDKKDWLIAQQENWYRIPLESRIPNNLRDEEVEWIAFYFPKIFGEEKYSIRYFARVDKVSVVAREKLFPDESINSKSDKRYRKISFGALQKLPNPIISQRGRMLLFIPTTFEKLINADELNDVFNDSPLEEKLWKRLKAEQLPAERQFYIKTNENSFICDFAMFCKNGVINVECDGEQHQSDREMVIYDKSRNNQIEAVANYSVLRFTTIHIESQMENTIHLIKQKVDKLGGIYFAKEDEYKYLSKPDGQLRLFG